MELIEKEQALAAIRQLVQLPNEMRAQAMAAVRRVKAADAKEVVHGRWLPIAGVDELYACSVCNEWQFVPEDAFEYCPRCGNPMDLPNITENTRKALEKMGENVHSDIDFDYAAEDD